MTDHLDSKNLIPFRSRRNGYTLPKMSGEEEEQVIDHVDPELRPEERGFVRYYLGYADVFLRRAHEEPVEEEQGAEETAEKPARKEKAA